MGLLRSFREWRSAEKKESELRNLAIGMNSTVDVTRDLHIVMLDYDIIDAELVEESVREVQDFWKLNDFYLFRTRNGFHAISFNSVVPYGRLKMIIEYAKYVDPMYKAISKFYDHRTLRAAGKYADKDISFFKIIKGKNNCSEYEGEIGEMKRLEHMMLSGVSYEVN